MKILHQQGTHLRVFCQVCVLEGNNIRMFVCMYVCMCVHMYVRKAKAKVYHTRNTVDDWFESARYHVGRAK